MKNRALSSICIAVCGLASFLGTGIAHATSITYVASGSDSDGSLAGEADFTTGAGFIDITLTNTLGAQIIRSSGQAISDLSFTLSNGAGVQSGLTATGQEGNINGSNVVTYVAGFPGRFVGIGGGSYTVSGDTITLEALGGGMPSEMIAPFLANGGTYSNLNGGFANFDPYNIGSVSFVLNLSGVTADTTITSASISFGTSGDSSATISGTVPGTFASPVPEPTSLLLLGTGVIGAASLFRRKTKKA